MRGEVDFQLFAAKSNRLGGERAALRATFGGHKAIHTIREAAHPTVWSGVVSFGGVDGEFAIVSRQLDHTPCHIVAAVAATIFRRILRHHCGRPTLEIQSIATGHENRFNAARLSRQVSGGESDQHMWRPLIALHGVRIEMFVWRVTVVQQLGIGPVHKVV